MIVRGKILFSYVSGRKLVGIHCDEGVRRVLQLRCLILDCKKGGDWVYYDEVHQRLCKKYHRLLGVSKKADGLGIRVY